MDIEKPEQTDDVATGKKAPYKIARVCSAKKQKNKTKRNGHKKKLRVNDKKKAKPANNLFTSAKKKERQKGKKIFGSQMVFARLAPNILPSIRPRSFLGSYIRLYLYQPLTWLVSQSVSPSVVPSIN